MKHNLENVIVDLILVFLIFLYYLMGKKQRPSGDYLDQKFKIKYFVTKGNMKWILAHIDEEINVEHHT